MYDTLICLAGLGLVGVIFFAFLSKVNEDNVAWPLLLIISLVVMFVGACGSVLTEEDYSVAVAQQHVAQELEVSLNDVVIDTPQCIASSRYSCVTWQATFHVSVKNTSGLVVFDTESATITSRWEGNLPPIGGLHMMQPSVFYLPGLLWVLVLLFVVTLTSGYIARKSLLRLVRAHVPVNIS